MKILLVNKFHYLRGGTERYCFDLSRLLQEKGHAVVPFAMRHARNVASEYTPYFVDEISFERSADLRRPLAAARAAGRAIYSRQAQRNLARLLAREGPDVAYLHNIHHQISLSILPTLKRKGIPILWRLHDYALFCPNSTFYSRGQVCEACRGGRYYRAVGRACRRGSRAGSLVACLASYADGLLHLVDRVDLFVAPSRFLAAKMAEHGLDGGRIRVQPNFVEPGPPASGREGRAGGGYLLYFGRLSVEKGVETLIRAVGEVSGVRLKVVGAGPERERLEAMAGRMAAGRVIFAGYQRGGALRESLDRAGAVVVPSEWYENCPYTILEAFARGKPVIAAAVGGIPELVDHGRDGLLFEAGDVGGLAAQIRSLAGDGRRQGAMGARAREKVAAAYGPEAHYAGFLELCAEVGEAAGG
jgi:glycosyltransferase involved in cell wall biosynthesis